MSQNQLSEQYLSLLRQYDTPTICNVIELFKIRPRTEGYMDARIKACFPEMPPIAGYAATAMFRGTLDRAEGSGYATLDDQIKAFELLPAPAIVVFQDLDDPPVAATFGEIMCSSYQRFGAVGLITSGGARDLDQVRRIGFPVFSSGAISSHGYTQILSVGASVRVGGLVVRPGDLLHADVNGVTNIPPEIAAEVAEAAAEYVGAEAVVLDFVKTGSRDLAKWSEARREMVRRIGQLSERVHRR